MPLYQSPEEKKKRLQVCDSALDMFRSSVTMKNPRRPKYVKRSNPLTHTRVKVVETLTKAHQMEGDGLLLLLYYQLFKKTWNSQKEFQSCPGARCPDTVVYEHNFPQHWYTYDSKHSELLKRPGSFLDTAQILKFFSRPVAKDSDIVAQYLCSHENPQTEEMETSVEFFTEATLKDFLHNRKNRPDGVLQRFIMPKGEHNFQIQAVWSPKVTLVYKRTNNYRMKDRTIGVYERCVTCDGPPHYSREDLLAEKTREEVVKLCSNFVSHFYSTEHKPVSRVVLYFKVDDRDNIWIMWASSMRIGTTKFTAGHQRIPLNLSTKFTTPDAEQKKRRENVEGEELEKKLLSQDIEQYKLSSDFMFATTFCCDGRLRPHTARTGEYKDQNHVAISPPRALLKNNETHTAQGYLITSQTAARCTSAAHRQSPRRPTACYVASDRPPFLPSPRLNTIPPPWSPTNPFHRQVLKLGLDDYHSPNSTAGAKLDPSHASQAKAQQDGAAKELKQITNSDSTWWKATARSEEDYKKILQNEQKVLSWAEDQLYHIYSHTLNHGLKVLYVLKPPVEIWEILCGGDYSNTKYADELMAALGLKEHDMDSDEMTDTRPSFYYTGYGCSARIQSEGVTLNPAFGSPSAMDRPMAQLARDILAAVTRIFDEIKSELHQWTIATQKQQSKHIPHPSQAGDPQPDGLPTI